MSMELLWLVVALV